MKATTGNYALLLEKLSRFKRKYYLNEIYRGGLYFTAVLLITYLVVTVPEYFGRFGIIPRTAMFYGFLAVNIFILARYIILPLIRLYNLGNTITHKQAADIIGRHFGEVKDKLLNTLQLHELASFEDIQNRQLLEAGIDQKINELRPVPFVKAIDYNSNRKYIKYALIPLVILLALLIRAPKILSESTQRLVHHDKFFEEIAPFKFVLKNDNLNGVRQEDFTVKLEITGDEIPAEASVLIDGNAFKMTSGSSKNQWSYTLKNLQKDIDFQFTANNYTSKPYTIKVLPRPNLQKFEVHFEYPAYIGKKDETMQNMGDITIPAGTKVTWKFFAENTDNIDLSFKDHKVEATRKGDNLYTFENKFLHDDSYYLKTRNKFMQSPDSIEYLINVVPDAYPAIQAIQQQDSAQVRNLYFTGQISDDYGFSKLTFVYHYTKSDDSMKMKEPAHVAAIAVEPFRPVQPFYYFWDANQLDIKPGDEIEYYFEVWDNDGVNGPKSARSQKFFFKAPSKKEIEQNAEASSAAMESKMESAMRQASELQKDLENARMKLMDKKQLDWQDKKAVEDILKKQQALENQVKQIQEDYKKNIDQQNEYSKMDEDILAKHQELQKMFDELMDDKTKKMLDELQKLMEQNNKDQSQQQMDQMKFQDKEVEKELDRQLALFKQLQFEQKMEEAQDKLNKLADDQKALADKTEQKDKTDKENKLNDAQKEDESKKLADKQNDLNQQFDDIKKDMQDLEKQNQEMENKLPLDSLHDQQDQIKQDMQQSQESLQKQNNKQASKSQKSAADKMKKMSDKMEQMKESGEAKELDIDYQALRQIVTNLLYLSFQQENLMNQLKTLNGYNPEYVELAQNQRKLKDDAKLIEDSLDALSKKVTEIKSFITTEMGLVNFNMEKTIDNLGDRNIPDARSHQQFVMTSANNLAVMLTEVMKKMQEQQKDGKPGSKMCNKPKKPGKGSKSMKEMKQMQEALNKEIQQMKDGQKGGKQPMSKELAETAAKQEAIRRELQRMEDMKNENGEKPGGDLEKMQKDMDKTEEDLVNKHITDETIKRQEDIMVRMIESEKAEKEQGEKEERESKVAQNHANPAPPSLEKFLQLKQKETELIQTIPPSLNPYYKEKVKEYFEELNN